VTENPTVVFTEPRRATIQRQDVPTPDPTEVLVETSRSLISTGTELTALSGTYPADSVWDGFSSYPMQTGYCAVGTVVEAGEDVDDDLVGRRVATRTPHRRFATTDVESSFCVPIPEGVSDEEATFFALGGIAMNGVRRGGVTWGDDVAIFGLGLVGQLAARVSRFAGARSTIGFDLADDRLAFLPDEPGLVAANPDGTDPKGVVEDATGGKAADVVFEATGAPDAIVDQLDVLRQRGRFVMLSSPRGETTIDFHDHCNHPSYEIVGAHEMSHAPESTHSWTHETYDWTHRRHYDLFLDLVAQDRLSVAELISHRVPFAEAPETYDSLLEDRSDALGVVLEW
jgi:2-desacetyl-2-hydroxyethyl bacteriochlorophyllide A dehydrogenase